MNVRVPSMFDCVPSPLLRDFGLADAEPRVRILFLPTPEGKLKFLYLPVPSVDIGNMSYQLGIGSISHLLERGVVTELSVDANGRAWLVVNGQLRVPESNPFAQILLSRHRNRGVNLQAQAQSLQQERDFFAEQPLKGIETEFDETLRKFLVAFRGDPKLPHKIPKLRIRAVCSHCSLQIGDRGNPAVQIPLPEPCTQYVFAPTWLNVLYSAYSTLAEARFSTIVGEDSDRRIREALVRSRSAITPPGNSGFD